MDFNIHSINSNIKQNVHVSQGVSSDFSSGIADGIKKMQQYSPRVNNALSKIQDVIILKDKKSEIPENFTKTKQKFYQYAQDAFGFVSKSENAIVIVQDNHGRKNSALEGSVTMQGEDTLSHEVGHLVDEELSTSDGFIKAYLSDLKQIHSLMKDDNAKVCGQNLKDMLIYLKHYMEGVNFEDGIDKSDVTREGLRENFAECFSTIVDSNPSAINKIYASLFPNTMKTTMQLIA